MSKITELSVTLRSDSGTIHPDYYVMVTKVTTEDSEKTYTRSLVADVEMFESYFDHLFKKVGKEFKHHLTKLKEEPKE